MRVTFTYNKDQDIWCLLNKGKGSHNSQKPTKTYGQLIAAYGENPSQDSAATFIDTYISENKIDTQEYTERYQSEWDSVADAYHEKAQKIFKISLPSTITGYLTINSRCPYSIKDGYFFVAVPTQSSRQTAMHELWHFYTWYAFGPDQEEKFGKEKYNDLKEALTVLLNVEFQDLLPEGISDTGYPQHKELRERILKFWETEKDIFKLWKYLRQ